MINWSICPMVYNDSFTYMEWLGKLSYIADNHETRIDDLEKNVTDITETLADHEERLTDHEGRITTLENWRTDTVEPFIVETDFRLDTLENWKTDTIEPFMINTANTLVNHNNRITAAEEDIVNLELKKGDLTIFPEITTSIDYTMEIETANCNVYYKNPNSDIWHEYATDTTMNDFIINETAESIGNKNFLFLFCPPEGYPEEQFIFSAGAVVTATAATSEDSGAAIYSRETIPSEDFNAGLVLCADGVVTTAEQVDTVVITNTDEVQNYSCLYLSNNYVLALLDPVSYSFGVSVSEIFGTLYSEKTGQNVHPRIKTNGTLVYDSNGVLGVSDEIANGAALATANRAELIDIVDNGFKNVLDLNAATNVIAGTGITYTFTDGILTVTWENITEGKTLKFKNIPHIDGTYILTGVQTLTDPTNFRADIRQGVNAADIIVMDYGQTNPDPFTFQSGVFDYVIRIAPESAETPTSGTATIKPMICSVPDYNISPLFAEYKEKINLLQLTQAEYDLIVNPDPHTLYIIVG